MTTLEIKDLHVSVAGEDGSEKEILKGVNQRYGRLFAGEEELSSRFGSLVFTGVEDDPETLATLKRMGFSSPERVAATIRGWHHGHIAATRTERVTALGGNLEIDSGPGSGTRLSVSLPAPVAEPALSGGIAP